MKKHIDIEEIKRMRICKDNLDMLNRHVGRLEKAILEIYDVIGQEKDLGFKIMKIASIVKHAMIFI